MPLYPWTPSAKEKISKILMKYTNKLILKLSLEDLPLQALMRILSTYKIDRVRELSQLGIEEKLVANYLYDYNRFSSSAVFNARGCFKDKSLIKTKTQLKALITMEYHRIEKGLSLKNPRVGFGKDVIQRLLDAIDSYIDLFGKDQDSFISIPINVLRAYQDFNRQHNHIDHILDSKIDSIGKHLNHAKAYSNSAKIGGVLKLSKEDILEKCKIDLTDFFALRYSIRNFSSKAVENDLIEKAVSMAQKTPSVCNRQSSKVYVCSESGKKEKVLSFQNGNRGFGDLISKVLIVTSDMQNFTAIGERNQCWIDGGMFSMSLLYALHSLGLGTCCLNWSAEFQTDEALRNYLNISNSEVVIMMIAVGHLPDTFFAAQSPRKNIEEVLAYL